MNKETLRERRLPGSETKGCFAMMGMDKPEDSEVSDKRDRIITFAMTLVVTTLMVALTAYVLSFALLGEKWSAQPPHKAAMAALHLRS